METSEKMPSSIVNTAVTVIWPLYWQPHRDEKKKVASLGESHLQPSPRKKICCGGVQIFNIVTVKLITCIYKYYTLSSMELTEESQPLDLFTASSHIFHFFLRSEVLDWLLKMRRSGFNSRGHSSPFSTPL